MAHSLDDIGFVTRKDPKGMLGLTAAFPEQCRKAFEIASAFEAPTLDYMPQNILLTGLGGSAAGGDFVRALFEAHGSSPFIVNREYLMPKYVGLESLVFVVSYSGNTEETLSAYADARRKGARIIAVTSGGRLAELAKADGVPLVTVPGGQPPRTALGYLLIPVVLICDRYGLIPSEPYERAFATLDRNLEAWKVEAPFEHNPAKQLAQAIHGRLPILYGLGYWQAVVAGRWKAQINENAKNHAFVHAFPELNHNEILGWSGCQTQNVPQWAIVLLQDGTEPPKLKARARITFELIGERAEVHHVFAEGVTLLERMLSLTFMGDWVSIYLAALNGVDPENIDWLNYLKAVLAKVE
jgi:glucose/mannose-6-phosphate isomerase